LWFEPEPLEADVERYLLLDGLFKGLVSHVRRRVYQADGFVTFIP
jgi:hypothetical protein